MSNPYQAFGLSCPTGGTFHICQGNITEFIGCCLSNPCDGSGKCPTADLRAASFSGDKYSDLLAQDCDDPTGTKSWYTCKGTQPPFMGCCASNPCANGSCPRQDVLPAKLSKLDANREGFISPRVSPAPTSASTSSASSTTLQSTGTGSSSPSTAGTEQQSTSLSTGAIAGIAVGIGALIIILIALLMWKFGWSAGKRRERDKIKALAPGQPAMGQQPSDYNESLYHDQASQNNGGMPSPYRDSYNSTAVGSPRNAAFSKHTSGYSSHSPDMHGQPFAAAGPGGVFDHRQPSPAYSSYSAQSGHPHPHHLSGGSGFFPGHGWSQHPGGALLPAVHEADSNQQVPQELDGRGAQGPGAYRPYVPPGDAGGVGWQQEQQQQDQVEEATLGSALSSPRPFPPEGGGGGTLVSDIGSGTGSQFASPVGSPGFRAPGEYAPVPTDDVEGGAGGLNGPQRGYRG